MYHQLGLVIVKNIKVDERVVIGGSSFATKLRKNCLCFGVPIKKIRQIKKKLYDIYNCREVNHNGDPNQKIIDFCMNKRC